MIIFDQSNKAIMNTLKNTPENNAKVLALRVVKETQWTGEVTHDTIEKALTAINLFSQTNSGWYNPVPVRIKGAQGIFMINQDGGLHFESRIIKIENGHYKIEHLTNSGYDAFESKYIEVIEA